MATFKKVFNFKTVKTKAFTDLLATVDSPEQVKALFEPVVEKDKEGKEQVVGYKRKPVEQELSEPAFLSNLPASAAEVIRDFVATYVKATYVDNFLPVGAHDWETIEKAIGTDGRAARKLSFAEETLAAVASSFTKYLASVTGQTKVAERAGEAVLAKLSINAIQKFLNQSDIAMMEKLKNRLTAWAEWSATNEPETAEEFVPVYEYLIARLEKNVEKLGGETLDCGSVL